MFASITDRSLFSGGIDLGGTKIETKLFDANMNEVAVRRTPTPRDNYDKLLAALLSEISWLRSTAGNAKMSVGLGLPGFIDPCTGKSITSNLPATGRMLQADLRVYAGCQIAVENDCNCFALSEAHGGGGEGFHRVFGLILGTGLGGGFCVDGALSFS